MPLPRLYTYRVPFELNDNVVIGGRVIVQFGAKKTLSCIVAAVHETPPANYQAKYILEFIDDAPVVTQPQAQAVPLDGRLLHVHHRRGDKRGPALGPQA
ncbi:primosomal protein N' family DNA-binding protein [Hymenobacter humi]